MPKWFKTWSEQVYEKNQRKQDEAIASIKIDIADVKAELANVIKLNNLKH
jgi:hypothetical protein